MQDYRIVYNRLRDPENRPFVVVFVVLLVMTLIVGCLVLFQFISASRQTALPLIIVPKALATMPVQPTAIVTAPAIILSETSTLPAPQKIIKAATAKVKATAKPKPETGQSCYYSSAALNQTLPPVPSGSYSPIEHYSCKNGYWEIGTSDVVNRITGAWGQDGIPEKILIKYDSSGEIADRIFIDPEGNQFSGPKN